MTLASIEIPSRASASSAMDPAAPPSPRAEHSEFGRIMSGVLQTTLDTSASAPGPALAAQAAMPAAGPAAVGEDPTGHASTDWSAVLDRAVPDSAMPEATARAALADHGLAPTHWLGDGLTAIHLGPRLNVITANTLAPDEQSLEAFARAQGLDESAVQWLMGGARPQPTPMTPVTPPAGLAMPAPNSTALQGTAAMAAAAEPALLTTSAQSGHSQGSPAQMPLPAASLTANALTAHAPMPDTLSAAAFWALAASSEKTPSHGGAASPPNEAATWPNLAMATPAPAALWLLRSPQAAGPTKEAPVSQAGIALSEIDLTPVATAELLESLRTSQAQGPALSEPVASEQAQPVSGAPGPHPPGQSAPRPDAPEPDARALTPDAGPAQRRENLHNLAEKMGQAVGQRILSEIEKGQWHLKLSLRPATLGHIEVEMRMRSGELDAVFTAPQALTRELLQEGMGKLKDSLSQMGMDVASMQVGDGQKRQSGEESTPGQTPRSTPTPADERPNRSVSAPSSAPPMKMGQDGWDVLV